jgi:hypothetical protein
LENAQHLTAQSKEAGLQDILSVGEQETEDK